MTPRAKGFAIWLAMVAIVILAGIAVPYTILSGPAFGVWDVPVFWIGFGFLVIALILRAVSRWRG